MEKAPQLAHSVLRNSLILGLFAMLTVAVIAITQQTTAERINTERERMQMRALNDILPEDQHDNDLLQDSFMLDDTSYLRLTAPTPAWRGRQADEVSAVILPVTTVNGYSGRIDLLVGIHANGDIAGVRAINHRETPGLGDKIEAGKSRWILNFNGKSLTMPAPEKWAVRRDGGDFDQFAGATITPRAVVQAVHNALRYFNEHRSSLLQLNTEDARND